MVCDHEMLFSSAPEVKYVVGLRKRGSKEGGKEKSKEITKEARKQRWKQGMKQGRTEARKQGRKHLKTTFKPTKDFANCTQKNKREYFGTKFATEYLSNIMF